MIAVTDIKAPVECTAELEKRGFEVIALPPFPVLPSPVASHPDMLIFATERQLLTHRDYYAIAAEQIDKIARIANRKLILTDEPVGNVYPHDVLLNTALVGDKIIGSRRAMSDHIIKYCALSSKKIIDTRQGYAKCSVCIVDSNALITADRGIACAAISAGIDVLTVTPGHVYLEGYDTGFIGGASGLFEDTVYFCGNISAHPDALAIQDFCPSHGKRVVSLGNGPLADVGTIFFF